MAKRRFVFVISFFAFMGCVCALDAMSKKFRAHASVNESVDARPSLFHAGETDCAAYAATQLLGRFSYIKQNDEVVVNSVEAERPTWQVALLLKMIAHLEQLRGNTGDKAKVIFASAAIRSQVESLYQREWVPVNPNGMPLVPRKKAIKGCCG